MNDYELSEITPNLFEDAKKILKESNLPHQDILVNKIYMMGIFKTNELVGTVGIELYGSFGLLRSLAVRNKYRSLGLGERLYNAILSHSLVCGLTKLFLLTTTADKYFEKFGWKRIDRESVPKEIKESQEFSELCPSTAVCMTLELPKSKPEQAERIFRSGFNCSQSSFLPFARDFELDANKVLKLTTGFGAGMVYRGETCGAVTGAMMAIGLKYGRNIASDENARDKTYELINNFYEEFKKRHGSIICNQLLGVEISTQEGKIEAGKKGLFQNLCPKLVKSAVEITENLLNNNI